MMAEDTQIIFLNGEKRHADIEFLPEIDAATCDLELPSQPQKNPHICSFCGKQFSLFRNLEKHERNHSFKIECELCGIQFARRSYLTQHMRTHSGEKPHECQICHAKFALKRYLVQHEKNHSAEKQFRCELCESSFALQSQLNRHKKNHSAVKPHSCNYCSSSFRDKSDLARHERIHTGEKPFACNFCNFKSHDRGSLGRHQKLLHSNVGEELKDCRETSEEDSSITLGSSDMLDLRIQPSPNDPQSNATSSSFCDDSSTGTSNNDDVINRGNNLHQSKIHSTSAEVPEVSRDSSGCLDSSSGCLDSLDVSNPVEPKTQPPLLETEEQPRDSLNYVTEVISEIAQVFNMPLL